MMFAIVGVIIAISWFDMRQIIKAKNYHDLVVFFMIAGASIIYGFYYSTHIYTSSTLDFLLDLFR